MFQNFFLASFSFKRVSHARSKIEESNVDFYGIDVVFFVIKAMMRLSPRSRRKNFHIFEK